MKPIVAILVCILCVVSFNEGVSLQKPANQTGPLRQFTTTILDCYFESNLNLTELLVVVKPPCNSKPISQMVQCFTNDLINLTDAEVLNAVNPILANIGKGSEAQQCIDHEINQLCPAACTVNPICAGGIVNATALLDAAAKGQLDQLCGI
ncbi:hypothetical protein FQA39_LY09228 [Lamprigera yunnana]|nr:hypothetical protein FQA39_LY09228 [Lamprigera yunnana]